MKTKKHTTPIITRATTLLSDLKALPNRWDFIAFGLIIGAISMVAMGVHQTMAPIETLDRQSISLNPLNLPEYALRTTLRMVAALLISLIFTLTYGTLAAKNRTAEKVLIPMLDILQSVPVLGYISFTVTFFFALFPGRVVGAECAAIFAIFTSQAWNMTFSFYQSLRTVPRDLDEVSRSFHLSAWQRFWKLDVPFSMPGLIWNMMMSMSGGWFFIVASEAINVGHHAIKLPGIGAYLAQAIAQQDLIAVGWVVMAMIVVIFIYDQLLFRPLVAWADKFRLEVTSAGAAPTSWVLDLIQRTQLIRRLLTPMGWLLGYLGYLGHLKRLPIRLKLLLMPLMPLMPLKRFLRHMRAAMKMLRGGHPGFKGLKSLKGLKGLKIGNVWLFIITVSMLYMLWQGIAYMQASVSWQEVLQVLGLSLITLCRVVLLIAITSVIWVPVGIGVGMRPTLAEKIQPIAQFLAAFPANLMFPVFVVAIVHFHLNPDLWLPLLMVLGAQWYILFNVIAGTIAYPNDFKEVAANFQIRGWQWYKHGILPGIFPYYLTGAITAFGGAWNASIVSEAVSWGDTHIVAHGVGAYIARMTAAGDYPHIILGIVVMSLFVTLFNRLFWRPLYRYAENRCRLD